MRLRRAGRPPWPVRVFAVDDVSAQLTWRASPASGLRLRVDDQVVTPQPSPKVPLVIDRGGAVRYLRAVNEAPPHGPGPHGPGLLGRYVRGWRTLDLAWPAGPGAVDISGLHPGRSYDVLASADGVDEHVVARFTTLVPPPGRLLARFATVSDIHIGEHHFGVLGRLNDMQHIGTDGERASLYPQRALQAAIDEAAAWGAELVVCKGDLTHKTTPAELAEVARLLKAGPAPVEAILGNHDNSRSWVAPASSPGGSAAHGSAPRGSARSSRARRSLLDAKDVLTAEGVEINRQARFTDLPGIRLVLVDSVHSQRGNHGGQLSAPTRAAVAKMVADAPQAAWVGFHHPPEMHRYPLAYPPGVPYGESRSLLDALVATGKPVMVSCGHRHRNRRYRYGPVEITEVGSTKDYPGAWAGYKVFEGGIMQVVRRVARPDVITWTENSRRAMNGQWGRWSPGRLEARCFSWPWPG